MALIDTVEHLRTGLDYHLQRHNLLASNLAHLDTPGYATVDLARDTFDGELHSAMAATQAGHLHGSTHTDQGFRVVEEPHVGPGGDGNGVDLDKETVKIASNQLRYDMIAQLASSELSSLSWAANDAKGG
ncbi:MAG: Flagellar basal-body rod protein FlgB [Labilithrix sp.]|nr:Flagellar basal-body rod protein FlgB [Labilithrix sp.]